MNATCYGSNPYSPCDGPQANVSSEFKEGHNGSQIQKNHLESVRKALNVSSNERDSSNIRLLEELDGMSPQLLERIASVLQTTSVIPPTVPSEHSSEMSSTADTAEIKYPAHNLDPQALKSEIDYLLELTNVEKTTPESSDWAEVLGEIANTISSHLQDIWVFLSTEPAELRKAHECLLLLYDLFDNIMTRKNGICICPFITLPIAIVFRDSSGAAVRNWESLNTDIFSEIMFWLWREMFMQVLLNNEEDEEEILHGMINELEERYGGCLHIILCGGSTKGFGIGDVYSDGASLDHLDDCFDETDQFYPRHWGDDLYNVWEQMKGILLSRLQNYFQFHPTLHGYLTLCSFDPSRRDALHKMIDETAPFSRSMSLCALAVHRREFSYLAVRTVLSRSSHLFASHDVQELVLATKFVLQIASTRAFAVEFMEKQLLKYVDLVKFAFIQTFKWDQIESSRQSLIAIAKLSSKSQDRKRKIGEWIRNLLEPQGFMDMLMSPFAIFGMEDSDEDEEDEEQAKEADFWNTDPTVQFHGISRTTLVTRVIIPLNDQNSLDQIYIPKGLDLWLSLVKSNSAHIPIEARKRLLLSFEKALYAALPWMGHRDVVAALKTE
ncbi:hypothetical protein FRC17_000917 [Serendipita sp. 399]|nr:hypothetical protein FRC17_000917 [Serendipita sp. 399]